MPLFRSMASRRVTTALDGCVEQANRYPLGLMLSHRVNETAVRSYVIESDGSAHASVGVRHVLARDEPVADLPAQKWGPWFLEEEISSVRTSAGPACLEAQEHSHVTHEQFEPFAILWEFCEVKQSLFPVYRRFDHSPGQRTRCSADDSERPCFGGEVAHRGSLVGVWVWGRRVRAFDR